MDKKELTMARDAAHIFAENQVKIKYDNIPAGAIEATKKSILDTLGGMLGASGTIPGCRELADLVKESGGREESSILAFGGKVPAWMAAFVNGGMSHGLDYDDLHEGSQLHPSACCVAAGFAMAERLGKVSGKEFITAMALGIDMACRMGMSVGGQARHFTTWHLSPTIGVFSSAATASKLLDLDEEKVIDAFGIALCQAGFTFEVNAGIGSNLCGAYPGFPAKNGVLAALMAQKGISGPKNSMNGKAGFFPVYFGGNYDREILFSDLGKTFEGENVGFKFWPACGGTSPYIDTLLNVVKEHDIQPDDIEQVTIGVGELDQMLFEPLDARRTPTTPLDAKYSMPFTLAIAIARRKVVIADYSDEGLNDPLVLDLAQKISPNLEKDVNSGYIGVGYLVELKTRDGKMYQERTGHAYGRIKNPMSMDDLVEKFRYCASVAVKPYADDAMEEVIKMLVGLEQVGDVGEVMRLLS